MRFEIYTYQYHSSCFQDFCLKATITQELVSQQSLCPSSKVMKKFPVMVETCDLKLVDCFLDSGFRVSHSIKQRTYWKP